MRLVVVRHGATESNLASQFTGHLDVPLSALGERQAQALASALAHEQFDALISSDLQRARATLAPLAELLGLPVRVDSALREIGAGVWEGQTGAAVRALYPGAIELWESSETFTPEGGESIAVCRERIVDVFERTCREFPDGSVLWMTHGGVLGILLCHVLGLTIDRRGQFRRDNTAIFEFDVRADRCIVLRANDVTHLRSLDMLAEQAQVL
ncbi:MAG TPA: histidine phosphatase family protein [Ktedonobacterales bacterium]|nr:histidine phosphatase family protein [Ktedonobacterales bacterium]